MIEKQAESLPAGYAAAERLATEMLAAATQDDWSSVVRLRDSVPAMAQALEKQWTAIIARDPQQALRLEKERLGAIMRVLAVDDQIRRLSDASSRRLDDMLRGDRASRRMNCGKISPGPAQPARFS